MKKELGFLKEVSARDTFEHEQYGFSTWLADENNLKLLGDALNLTLVDAETEKFVGNYRCDILCKDELTGKTVLIENQLEATNHDHLGKLVTYASGLDASVVVWIVTNAREEHASAIEWLNKNTTDDLAFFLIEIHVYQIGNSIPAPYFKIIEKPNDFAKSAKMLSKQSDMNASQEYRLDFWNKFNDVLESKGRPFNKRKAKTDHWYDVAIGSSQCHVTMELVNKEHRIRVSLYITNNKELFDSLHERKEEIENDCGINLEWWRLDDKKASIIGTYINGLNFEKQDNYPELINKTIDTAILLRDTFKKYI